MTPRTKNEKLNEKTINSITNVIEQKSYENGWNDTLKKWIRNCPKCGREIYYSQNKGLKRAIKANTNCQFCLHQGKLNPMFGRKHSRKSIEKMRVTCTGKKASEETRKKMSENNRFKGVHRYGKDAAFYGRRHTEEWKQRMRVLACQRLSKLQIQRNDNGQMNNVGKKEGEYFVALEKEKDWNGVFYQKSGKQFLLEDLGYFLDYYEPNLNIVVEYDEPRHYVNGKLQPKDLQRMDEIKKNLRCKFLRFNERNGELKEF